jgi:hypothetical protein
MEKYEWKKKEKNLYLPKAKHEIIDIPSFKFFTLEGKGNPNDEFFADYVGALYSLSYGVKMSYKKGIQSSYIISKKFVIGISFSFQSKKLKTRNINNFMLSLWQI